MRSNIVIVINHNDKEIYRRINIFINRAQVNTIRTNWATKKKQYSRENA